MTDLVTLTPYKKAETKKDVTIRQQKKQLTIAKDLIHQFLIQNPISDWLPKKAEQFLKEIEK